MGCVVIQDKHYYYLSPKYIKKKVIVKFTATKIYFYDEFNRPLLDCVRLYDNTNAIFVNWGEYFKLLSVKTGALTACNILDSFPETLKDFLLDSDIKTRRNYMLIMHEIYAKTDFEAAIAFANNMAKECIVSGAE